MLMLPPPNCHGINIAGQEYLANEDGLVDIPPTAVDDAQSHGFVIATDAPVPAAKPEIVTKTVEIVKTVEVPVPSPEDNPDSDATAVGDIFDGMNRNGLFSWLRDHGVTASPPITNDALRALARANVASNPQAQAAVVAIEALSGPAHVPPSA